MNSFTEDVLLDADAMLLPEEAQKRAAGYFGDFRDFLHRKLTMHISQNEVLRDIEHFAFTEQAGTLSDGPHEVPDKCQGGLATVDNSVGCFAKLGQ